MSQSASLRKVLAGAALLAIPAALLLFFLQVRSQFDDVREFRELVDQSVEVRDELSTLLTEHLDLETGQRGFVLTRDLAFLAPYSTAKSRIGLAFSALEADLDGKPEQEERLARLRALSAQKLAFAARTVALARAGDDEGARAIIASGEGKRLMDAIRTEIEALDRLERDRLAYGTSSRNLSRVRVETTTYALLAGFTLLLALVALVTGRAIRERRREFARANELSERQRAILNGTVDGLLLLDGDGYIREINPSIERQFGFTAAELIGKHNSFLMHETPDLAASVAWLHRVGSAGRDGAGKRLDFTGRHKDGSILETDVAISRIAGEGERSYVAIIRDVTERKRIESMKTEFVSTVSHELRTPLTSIGGSLGLLASGAVGPLGEKAARLVQIAHSNCDRLIRLINDILDIEKIESGKMHFDLKRMRVAPLIDRVVQSNAQFAAGHGVDLKVNHAMWPLMIEGDADRLDQLLTNLVSNAIKHSPRGSEVEITALQNGDRVCIEVADRGSGVPLDFRDRIFGKFAMADGSDNRARGGTGLGLSIAREIAQRHGGTVTFSDRPGGGTVFAVDFPLICEATAAPRETASADLPLVLHLDDDQDCLDVVASAFEGKADLLSVGSLDEARKVIAEKRFAAAIIDVSVDPDNGMDLVPILRDKNIPVPIVLFTAFDAPYRDAGVNAVLVKSRNSVDELVATTMRLAARTRKRAA